ncbi:uncharacterized protein LOC123872826 [Maniola jurtina]|uniref:uncharacterized protein LOC123872826 n=1 Tax=Maniola jurtina TaxID=191418 RepID=UPI001E68C3DF|nr:uncharacterized protein LOC123872826 [Maniola jurtina]
MVRIASKRARTPNWSPEEKQYLLELIKEHKEVVITKPNNGPNHSEEKDVAWNDILRKLAVKFGNKFTGLSIKKVKTQWQNMRRIARDEIVHNAGVVNKYSRQSFEVCNLLDLIKDGVLKDEKESNETTMTTNIEIKTESIDEDTSQPSCSNTNLYQESLQEKVNDTRASSSCVSESTEIMGAEDPVENQENIINKKSASSMTEPTLLEDSGASVPVDTEKQEFLKYSVTEKQLKIESLKEERQVFRAMRETAELNKIIAEQKLKHILWMKNREMAIVQVVQLRSIMNFLARTRTPVLRAISVRMYAGEPGSGAGKGGGGGGAIREAGGAFGKMEAAREDEYFYKKQKEQLANLRGHLDKEIAFHQEQIKRHEDAIRRHKEQMAGMNPEK